MMKKAAALFLVCASSACVTNRDISQWLVWEKQLQVTEVRRSQQCGTADAEARVHYFPDLAAVKVWEQQHHLELTAGTPVLRAGPYALVEMGLRSTAGYGLAVSRLAGRRKAVLSLKATFITPEPGEVLAEMLTSPCVLISLPQRPYSGVEVVDQGGRLRASSED